VQYTRRDWRNRNRIKTPSGVKWLTIPVENKGRYLQKIKDTQITDSGWNKRHWQTILHHYSRAEYFQSYKAIFEELYLDSHEKFLSRVNYRFLSGICRILEIGTRLTWSMDYRVIEGKTERLVDLCRQAGASEYLSGPSAKGYIEEEYFRSAGIGLRYMDYSGYLEYHQLHGDFVHEVSIVDLIFNQGPAAVSYLKSFDGAGGDAMGNKEEA
jgi:hypothetical protein